MLRNIAQVFFAEVCDERPEKKQLIGVCDVNCCQNTLSKVCSNLQYLSKKSIAYLKIFCNCDKCTIFSASRAIHSRQ